MLNKTINRVIKGSYWVEFGIIKSLMISILDVEFCWIVPCLAVLLMLKSQAVCLGLVCSWRRLCLMSEIIIPAQTIHKHPHTLKINTIAMFYSWWLHSVLQSPFPPISRNRFAFPKCLFIVIFVKQLHSCVRLISCLSLRSMCIWSTFGSSFGVMARHLSLHF